MTKYLDVAIELGGYPSDAVKTICSTLTKESVEWTAFREIKPNHYQIIPAGEAQTEQANMRVSHTRVEGRVSPYYLYTLFGALTIASGLVRAVAIGRDEE